MTYRTWIFAGLLVSPLLVGCGKKEEEGSSVVSEKFDSPWSSEEHWMVGNIVRDLQGMASLAGGKIASGTTSVGKGDHEFQVGTVKLSMAPSCWDTASYKDLLSEWKASSPPAASVGPDLIHDLLTPTAKVLQKANKTVSERIKATPADSQAHEEAAFLLGVFGMRERARQFGDLRPLVCRMTAHLAVAEHLRGGTEISTAGKWATVFYHIHAGRPRKARDLAGAIPAEGDSGRWKRAVELLVTSDWRRGDDLSDPSLLESIALSRALKEHRGNPDMLEFAASRKDLQAIPEWSRSLAAHGKSVEEGHIAMRSGLAMELMEIAEIFPVGSEPEPDKTSKFLVAESPLSLVGKDGVPKVIQDGDWAAYFRRHLFACGADIAAFAIRQWSSEEAAADWEETMLSYCKPLPGHELLEPFIATDEKDYQEDLRTAADYIRHHPEQVPTGLWFDYRFPNLSVSAETNMPNQVPWFREVSPPGTAHSPRRRIRFTGIQDGNWVKHIAALHEIDPWDSELCSELAENSGNNFASVKQAWGEVREYSIKPLRQNLQSPSITMNERLETLQTLAGLDPEEGLDLGAALVVMNRPEEAIKAYESAFNDASDRVAVSNQSQWMIYYYKSKGMDEKAREVANHNAEVYSHRGLVSALSLAVAENDTARAKKLASDIAERYNDSTYLPVAAWSGGKNEKLLREIFPDGLKTAKLADFDTGKPMKGVRMQENSVIAGMVGLRQGDIILAVDGKRVESFQQYFMLMATSLEPKVNFIYRRGKKVAEIGCTLPSRRLDVDMSQFGQ